MLSAAFESWFNSTKEEWESWWTGQSGGIEGYMLQDTYDSAKTGALFVKATHVKEGTVHKLTIPSVVAKAIWFLATDKFDDGDTFEVNGTAQDSQLINGDEVPGDFFVQGAEVSCFKNNDTLTFGGGGSMGKWKFITAATLPETVAKNTFIAITANTPTTITVSDDAPANPENNHVWYDVVDPSGGDVNSDGTVPFRCLSAYQWNSSTSEWESLDAYYSWLDNWREVKGLPPAGGGLADYSWDEINRIGALGRATEYFSIGETKQVVLTTGEIITLVLVGFNSDALASDPTTYAPYSFHMQNCMNTKQQMELTNTNVNGWNGCRMRTTVLPEILLTLPAELQSVIKTVVKKSSAGNQSSNIVQTNDKLWLASEIEIFGTLTYSKSGEGSQYPYYATSGNRVKMVSNAAAFWWERSPYATDATYFCHVNASGTASYSNASYSHGVAFGLCV